MIIFFDKFITMIVFIDIKMHSKFSYYYHHYKKYLDTKLSGYYKN
jgi:hypothetical protein